MSDFIKAKMVIRPAPDKPHDWAHPDPMVWERPGRMRFLLGEGLGQDAPALREAARAMATRKGNAIQFKYPANFPSKLPSSPVLHTGRKQMLLGEKIGHDPSEEEMRALSRRHIKRNGGIQFVKPDEVLRPGHPGNRLHDTWAEEPGKMDLQPTVKDPGWMEHNPLRVRAPRTIKKTKI